MDEWQGAALRILSHWHFVPACEYPAGCHDRQAFLVMLVRIAQSKTQQIAL
jgi:hypothetical protein